MIDLHVLELSLAIEDAAGRARDGDELADLILDAYPAESVLVLRRAIYYAVTDPGRKDGALTLKLFEAAFAIMARAQVPTAYRGNHYQGGLHG